LIANKRRYSYQVETNDTASFDTADFIVDKKTLAAYAAKKQRSGGIFAGRGWEVTALSSYKIEGKLPGSSRNGR